MDGRDQGADFQQYILDGKRRQQRRRGVPRNKGDLQNLGSDAYAFSAIGVTGTVNDKYKLEGSIKSNKSTVGPLSTESIYVVLPTSNEMKETFQIGMITLDVRATEPYGTSGYTHGDTIAKYTLAASA